MGLLTLNAGVRWDRCRNWLPEQRQVAYSHGTPELTIEDQTFAETNLNYLECVRASRRRRVRPHG